MARVFVLIVLLACASTAVDGAMETRRVIHAPAPKYPTDARERHLSGSGIFALHIRIDGTVGRVEIRQSIGHRSLDAAAVAALRQWTFPRYDALWTLGVPIRYVDGPPRFDKSLDRPPCPNCLKWVSVFSRAK